MSDAPLLLVYLDPVTGRLDFKRAGVKGARWRTARADLAAVMGEARREGVVPDGLCVIEFVSEEERRA